MSRYIRHHEFSFRSIRGIPGGVYDGAELHDLNVTVYFLPWLKRRSLSIVPELADVGE